MIREERTKLRRLLRRSALEAFRAGIPWRSFWDHHRQQAVQVEPFDVAAFRRLEGELLHLVVSGERSGQFAAGDDDALCPWDRDDAAGKPHDTRTAARLQLDLFDFSPTCLPAGRSTDRPTP